MLRVDLVIYRQDIYTLFSSVRFLKVFLYEMTTTRDKVPKFIRKLD